MFIFLSYSKICGNKYGKRYNFSSFFRILSNNYQKKKKKEKKKREINKKTYTKTFTTNKEI